MLNQNFVILGAIIFFFGSIGYLVETLQGKVKPNKVTWFLWALAPLVVFFAEIKQGVGIQSLFTFMAGFMTIFIFLASFLNKNANWKIERLDIICGLLSIVGLILWQITKVGNIAILFSIFADFIAAFPTIVKSYKEPETENWVLYFTGMISATITLLTIQMWSFQEFAFPLYILIIDVMFTILIKFKIGKKFGSTSRVV